MTIHIVKFPLFLLLVFLVAFGMSIFFGIGAILLLGRLAGNEENETKIEKVVEKQPAPVPEKTPRPTQDPDSKENLLKVHHREMNYQGKMRDVTNMEYRARLRARGIDPDDPEQLPDFNPGAPENQIY